MSNQQVSVDYNAVNSASQLLQQATETYKGVAQTLDGLGNELASNYFLGTTGTALQKALEALSADLKKIFTQTDQMQAALTQSVAGYQQGDTSGASGLTG